MLRFFNCPHVNHDHNLVAVNSALENGFLKETDVSSYTNIFKPFVQAKATAHSQFFFLQAFYLGNTLTK